jgi:exoribonuclease R
VRSIVDPTNALAAGLAAIRKQFSVREEFPEDVLAEAAAAAAKPADGHRDRTAEPFVTLDPASSTDLDQAFTIGRSGNDILLNYAIADIASFVVDGGALDAEAWARGTTLYLPDGKARLYPPVLCEDAASLLPGSAKRAVVFTVRIAPDGTSTLDGAERALVRTAAKLAYETVIAADLPPDFEELARRIQAAEEERGAARIDPPEQLVIPLGDGRYGLEFRPMLKSERDNAALSLAANIAIAEALFASRTGLFRVMPEPEKRAVRRLRLTARALGLDWPDAMSLDDYERGLNGSDPRQAAFMHAVRRAGPPAGYAPYRDGEVPWHSAMAATYVHATAPLRRLADRYVVEAALAIANGKPVPDGVAQAFERLAPVMTKADSRSGQIERAVVDLAESVMLRGKEGGTFAAVVTDVDQRGARMQLCDLPVVARVSADGTAPGDGLDVRLDSADPVRREVKFSRA